MCMKCMRMLGILEAISQDIIHVLQKENIHLRIKKCGLILTMIEHKF